MNYIIHITFLNHHLKNDMNKTERNMPSLIGAFFSQEILYCKATLKCFEFFSNYSLIKRFHCRHKP